MRSLGTALIAGVGALGLAGFAGTASAQSAPHHVLTVPLPDGGVAQIRYSGPVAPQVTVTPGAAGFADFAPMPAMFGPGSPFAAMQRISARMDHEAAAMLRQAAVMTAHPWPAPGQVSEAALHAMPPGSASYSFVSTIGRGNFCSQSVEITKPANGGAPHVVRHRSGNCGPVTGTAGGTVALPGAPAKHGPDQLWTRNETQPYPPVLREADWRH